MEAVLLPEEAFFEVEAPVEDLAPPEDESEGALVDFASPTIAELYYSQGQIDAAIHTYERVLGSNPEDQESLRRLKELKGMFAESPSDAGEKAEVAFPGRKERMITILERWLPKIMEIKYG
jgi:tetratricopeptide (TPR) repeat protein